MRMIQTMVIYDIVIVVKQYSNITQNGPKIANKCKDTSVKRNIQSMLLALWARYVSLELLIACPHYDNAFDKYIII